ncbi:MAG: hypothetical protein P1V97_19190 [Planctomycetota bacterium]|nr:hypothetical protein [Planctomycetota bacterium]
MDKQGDNYEADTNFSIQGPGNTCSKFTIANRNVDPKVKVKDQHDAFVKIMPEMKSKRFQTVRSK